MNHLPQWESVALHRGIEFKLRGIIKNPQTPLELKELAQLGEVSVLALINPKSRALKELGVDITALSADQAAELLSLNPKAMIRSLYQKENKVVIGFNPVNSRFHAVMPLRQIHKALEETLKSLVIYDIITSDDD